MFRRRRAAASLILCLLQVLTVVACSTTGPRQTRLMKGTEITISAAQLRVQVRSLAGRFSGLMEDAGEATLRQETDADRRRAILQWLTNGIPAMQQALFEPDPLAALVDAQFLIAQMRQFLGTADDSSTAARYRSVAEAALDEMESDIALIIENAGPQTDYDAGRKLVYETAERYPTDSSFASRRASTALLAEYTARAGQGALTSIGSITETIEDLVARVDLNAEYIPKFARWQAQLFVLDEVKTDRDYEATIAAVQQLQHLELVATFLEDLEVMLTDLPEIAAREREEVLDTLSAELARTLAFADGQRATLMRQDVPAEREAILAAVREERAVILAAIADERAIVLEALREERRAAFDDLDSLVNRAVSREVDKFFVRALILIVLALGGLAAITVLAIRALNRPAD